MLRLRPDEAALLAHRLGAAPGAGSPLAGLPEPALAAEARLLELGALIREGLGLRLNAALADALEVLARPDEVFDLTTRSGDGVDGFCIYRRDARWVQCDTMADGSLRLFFPLAAEELLRAVAAAFSGSRSRPPVERALGLTCRPAQLFLLAELAGRFGADAHPVDEALEAIEAAFSDPTRGAPLVGLLGPEEIVRLAREPGEILREVAELARIGALTQTGATVRLEAELAAFLTDPVERTVTLQRIDPRRGRVASFQALAMRDRLAWIVPEPAPENQPLIRFEEIDRERLRLAALSLFDPEGDGRLPDPGRRQTMASPPDGGEQS